MRIGVSCFGSPKIVNYGFIYFTWMLNKGSSFVSELSSLFFGVNQSLNNFEPLGCEKMRM